jgi:ubiquinone/menaquinone biosynthesis C-methylase UbiE
MSNTSENPLGSLPWSERASHGELSAVLDITATRAENIIMHGATLMGAHKVLSLTRKRGIDHPVVLDFGCGTGRMIRFFGERGCSIIGLDVTIEMLEAAKKHGLPKNSALAHFDGLSIPLKDCSVDIVWICAVLKYTLFPPGSRCLGGIVSSGSHFVPTCAKIAKEMYRVLRPGGIVANYEMYIDEPPDVFRPSFEQAGFVTEQVKLLRRTNDRAMRFYKRFGSRLIPPLLVSRILVNLRYYFDDPSRAGFRDYLIVWRKPLERGCTAQAKKPEGHRARWVGGAKLTG